MTYFSRRNEYLVEYSGHEEMSEEFRDRLKLVLTKYIGANDIYGDRIWFADQRTFLHRVGLEFPNRDFSSIIHAGKFHEVFTIIEIFSEMATGLDYSRRKGALDDIANAFGLSGSVYRLANDNHVELQIDPDSAQKIESVKEILLPLPEFYKRFFQAAGNLLGRRAKPEDIVKDVYVAAEGYLKQITDTSKFGDAIKELFKTTKINKEQKKVLEALNEFRSDCDGAGHAGNSKTPTEQDALWFIDTMVSQLRMIDKTTKNHERL